MGLGRAAIQLLGSLPAAVLREFPTGERRKLAASVQPPCVTLMVPPPGQHACKGLDTSLLLCLLHYGGIARKLGLAARAVHGVFYCFVCMRVCYTDPPGLPVPQILGPVTSKSLRVLSLKLSASSTCDCVPCFFSIHSHARIIAPLLTRLSDQQTYLDLPRPF